MFSSLSMTGNTRSNWIRLRTLAILRWIAIAGQIAAIAIAQRFFGIDLELGLCGIAVGASVIANIAASFVYPANKRLVEGEAFMMLLFDICQLAFLLYLTGGLSNPFALLILAPVTISATALRPRSTIILGGIAIALISFLVQFHIPLRTDEGLMLRLPDVFVFGFWAAIFIGIVFQAIYAQRVTSEIHSMSDALMATQIALAREQKLTEIGGVVAAAAHELGTPLATIKLTSAELMEELSDRPELRDDAELIRNEAKRCRDILHSMSRAGSDGLHPRQEPLAVVLREAAAPHSGRGKEVRINLMSEDSGGGQPEIEPTPEIVHGLRNLVQNAVDFAATTVWICAEWSENRIEVRIVDDGEGFPPHLMGRIGDPFVRRRRNGEDSGKRPEYEGMGLGLFIAKTLLERSGAKLCFSNGKFKLPGCARPGARSGASVEIFWPREAVSPAPQRQ